MSIDALKPGCLPDPPDPRDYRFEFIASGAAPVIWGERLNRPKPPPTNQGSADCCTAEGASKAHWILTGIQFCVRSIFAWIALPDYGAYGRDAVMRIVNNGQETLQEATDPDPKTWANMRSREGLTPADALDDREQEGFSVNAKDINEVAKAIRDHKHVMFGVMVSWQGWQDPTNPRPPKYEESSTGHFICGDDYHLHDGQKCIIAASSWCTPTHDEHHIKEDYFNSGNTYSAWVIVKRDRNMVKRYIVEKGGKLGVLVSVDGDGIFTDTIFWAKSEQMFADLKKQYEVPDNAPRVVMP